MNTPLTTVSSFGLYSYKYWVVYEELGAPQSGEQVDTQKAVKRKKYFF
jgi:hypothetical protein